MIGHKWETYLDLLQADYEEGSAPKSCFALNISASLNFYYYLVLLVKLYQLAVALNFLSFLNIYTHLDVLEEFMFFGLKLMSKNLCFFSFSLKLKIIAFE